MFRNFILLMLTLLLAGAPVHAQKQRALPQVKQKQLKGIPGPAIRRFLLMSPAERETALQQLPPARRAQLETRVRRLERMRPADRERTLRRLELFDAIPPGRRVLVRNTIEQLRAMPPRARAAYLSSDEAKLRFDQEELELLRDVSGLPPGDDVQ